MKSDSITLLYYTAHALPDFCADRVRKHLLSVSMGLPIVSVSQKPIQLGHNICVGEIGKSYYNCYKQIFTGALEVKTDYVVCCEDDTLYSEEHFKFRPSTDEFYYNRSMWYLEKDRFWHKGQTGMFGCVVPTKLLVDSLRKRFELCPTEPLPRRSQRHSWMEPGKKDGTIVKYFETEVPLITFNYFDGLGGKTISTTHAPQERTELEYWGNARSLFSKYWR